MRPLAKAPDEREAAHQGESKNAHFEDARQKSLMAGVFRSRVQDQKDLTFGGEPYGDD